MSPDRKPTKRELQAQRKDARTKARETSDINAANRRKLIRGLVFGTGIVATGGAAGFLADLGGIQTQLKTQTAPAIVKPSGNDTPRYLQEVDTTVVKRPELFQDHVTTITDIALDAFARHISYARIDPVQAIDFSNSTAAYLGKRANFGGCHIGAEEPAVAETSFSHKRIIVDLEGVLNFPDLNGKKNKRAGSILNEILIHEFGHLYVSPRELTREDIESFSQIEGDYKRLKRPFAYGLQIVHFVQDGLHPGSECAVRINGRGLIDEAIIQTETIEIIRSVQGYTEHTPLGYRNLVPVYQQRVVSGLFPEQGSKTLFILEQQSLQMEFFRLVGQRASARQPQVYNQRLPEQAGIKYLMDSFSQFVR